MTTTTPPRTGDTGGSPAAARPPVLKHVPGDFIVREVLVPSLCDPGEAEYEYCSLSKAGFTTMEATRIVAAGLGLPNSDVTYAGLKDEDGVTEQLLALPIGTLDQSSWDHPAEGRGHLRLTRVGYGPTPLRVGRLEGNAFRIVMRDLAPERGETLAALGTLDHYFLNYYDIQRFGVPGGVRRTHHVGAAMLDGRWDDALRELVGLRAPESAAAAQWSGPARDYFAAVDGRTSSFYLAAHASAHWNVALGEAVQAMATDSHPVEVDGIGFRYLDQPDDARILLARTPAIDYPRYSVDAGEISQRTSDRRTVVQTRLTFGAATPDEYHPGRQAVEVSFFLPSGSYATAALRQLPTAAAPGHRSR